MHFCYFFEDKVRFERNLDLFEIMTKFSTRYLLIETVTKLRFRALSISQTRLEFMKNAIFYPNKIIRLYFCCKNLESNSDYFSSSKQWQKCCFEPLLILYHFAEEIHSTLFMIYDCVLPNHRLSFFIICCYLS